MKKLASEGELQKKITEGVCKLTDAVSSTLGPKGRNVILKDKDRSPHVTKDGVSIAKHIRLSDPFEDAAAAILKQSSEQTAENAGDGPQPLYSKVLTPSGWKTMGEIRKGETICGTNNSIQVVLETFEKGEREVYKVITADGREVECCEDHLWTIKTQNGKQETLTTKEMLDSGVYKQNKRGDKLHKFYLPLSSVEFSNDKELPLDPYFLGVLLGNGYLGNEKRAGVEISLGLNDRFILEKIKLPEGCVIIEVPNYKKNYIKVRVGGSEKHKSIVKNILRGMNLLGKTCEQKFIPQDYLFSSIENRRKLLEGLIDTDGHYNKRGLFEFSTINEQLYLDVLHLCRSLGIPVYSHKLIRNYNPKNYSQKPIFRVYQLKSYKNGIKIKDIVKTGKTTEMKCLKVSNEDHLYITDDFVPTHNTTTSLVLARAMLLGAQRLIEKHGFPPIEIQRGMNQAKNIIVSRLAEHAVQVSSLSDIQNIATISTNGDKTLGKLIANAVDAVGRNGSVALKEAHSSETSLDLLEGFRFASGYIADVFMTDKRRATMRYENALLLVTDCEVSQAEHVMKACEFAGRESKPLIIVAENIEGEALAALIYNLSKGNLKIGVIKAPFYGESRLHTLQDLATATGAKFISRLEGGNLEQLKLNHLGQIHTIESSKFMTTIVAKESETVSKAVQEKLDGLYEMIKDAPMGRESELIQQRINHLSSAVALIKVGAPTEVEMREKKDRIEDALEAAKSAQEEGILPGGGIALFKLSRDIKLEDFENEAQYSGGLVVKFACQEPLVQMLLNAGLPEGKVKTFLEKVETSDEFAKGWDIAEKEFCNMIERGIIDPKKVTRCALENAVSAAGTLVTTSFASIEIE